MLVLLLTAVSKLAIFGIAIVPVNVGLANGAFVAIELVTVVEKLASSPKAAASSFNVFNASGDESTKFDTAVETNAVVATFSRIISS